MNIMDKKIVLIGAGSAAFGPVTVHDILSSKVLPGSTIVLHDIDAVKLGMIYDLVVEYNRILGNKFTIEQTLDRKEALQDADFVICSIENGNRFELRWQDNTIPRKHGTTEMMAENGGPGGFFHSARQIPTILKVVKDVDQICPNALFINYSNPVSRICLAISRAYPNLRMVGLCHQIGLLIKHLPPMLHKNIEDLQLRVGGLNHFAFLLGLRDVPTGQDLLPEFNAQCMEYFKDKWDRFEFADLTFEVYQRFGCFPYVGDNHLCEYLQFASHYVKIEDIRDWITKMEQNKSAVNELVASYHRRLKKGRDIRKTLLFRIPSSERAVPIIEATLLDSNSYEVALNIPNDGIITNLPQDLVIECSALVNGQGIRGISLGAIPKNIAALLRIEASIQDLCVEAILSESKDLAIACLALDVNCGRFEMAENIFKEMTALQKQYLPNFK